MRQFRLHDRIILPPTSPLIISVSAEELPPPASRIGMGYVASDGHFGTVAFKQSIDLVGSEGLLVGKLRAVHTALRYVKPETAVFQLDCAIATEYLRMWQRGSFEYPQGYPTQRSNGASSLANLAFRLNRDAATYSFEHNTDFRAGQPLSAAFALGNLGLSMLRLPPAKTREQAHAYAVEQVSRALKQE
jgi:hypothetical protein